MGFCHWKPWESTNIFPTSPTGSSNMAHVLLLGISLSKLFYISGSACHLILIETTVSVFGRKYNYNSNIPAYFFYGKVRMKHLTLSSEWKIIISIAYFPKHTYLLGELYLALNFLTKDSYKSLLTILTPHSYIDCFRSMRQ